jgi:hypothetical protein
MSYEQSAQGTDLHKFYKQAFNFISLYKQFLATTKLD